MCAKSLIVSLLIALWGSLGLDPWWQRTSGVVAGVGYLGTLFGFSIYGPVSANYFVVSLGTLFIVGVLLVFRWFRVRICVATNAQVAARRMQFTIRQLLLLTFIVACLVSLGKWLAPHLMNVSQSFYMALIGLDVATVGLLSVWPVLGAGRPVLPSLILIVVAGGMGFCLAQFLPGPPTSDMARFWVTITSVEALSLAASLRVVRSCGYRLMRLGSSCTGNRSVKSDAC